MNVTFYNFSKRVNSTARPSGGVSVDCYLKSPCSTTHPTLDLQFTEGTDPASWNMCYIATFNRYYYISEWVYDESVWTAHCSVDALASWKDDIGEQSCYVLRAASTFDPHIRDDLYPTEYIESVETSFDGSYPYNNRGFYVIGVSSSAGLGPINYYALSRSEFEDLNGGFWTDFLQQFTDYNPLNYISSVRWFPLTNYLGEHATFTIGYSSSRYTGLLVGTKNPGPGSTENDTILTAHMYTTIPRHPYSLDRGDYLDKPPYTQHRIVWYPFGDIALTMPSLYYNDLTPSDNKIYIELSVDLTTGEALAEFTSSYGDDKQYATANYGVDIAIGASAPKVGKTLMSVALTGAAVAGGLTKAVGTAAYEHAYAQTLVTKKSIAAHEAKATKAIMTAIPSATRETVSGIAEAAQNLIDRGSIMGYPTSRIFEPPMLVTHHLIPAEDSQSEYGRPLCKTKKLNSLSGYIKCANSDISISSTSEELDAIKSFLDTGFFYE